jgi:hypothetical protein
LKTYQRNEDSIKERKRQKGMNKEKGKKRQENKGRNRGG